MAQPITSDYVTGLVTLNRRFYGVDPPLPSWTDQSSFAPSSGSNPMMSLLDSMSQILSAFFDIPCTIA